VIQVVAGILRRGERLLICQRHHSDRFPLKWEFPGGKVLAEESPEQALVRELKEELGIEAEVGPMVAKVRHAYQVESGEPGARHGESATGREASEEFEILFFAVARFAGAVENLAFEAVAWVEPRYLLDYDFLEADLEIVRKMVSGEVTP
jgi:8-oxo-dGTP diphosphatase